MATWPALESIIENRGARLLTNRDRHESPARRNILPVASHCVRCDGIKVGLAPGESVGPRLAEFLEPRSQHCRESKAHSQPQPGSVPFPKFELENAAASRSTPDRATGDECEDDNGNQNGGHGAGGDDGDPEWDRVGDKWIGDGQIEEREGMVVRVEAVEDEGYDGDDSGKVRNTAALDSWKRGDSVVVQ
jgi:hypothetical protein